MLDRVLGPAAFTPHIIDLPLPEKSSLSNDNKVFLFNTGQQKVCKLEIVFQGGKSVEEINGASLLTSKLLTKGTRTRSATEFSEYLDYYGAFLDISATLDDNQVVLYCQSDHLVELLPLLAEMLYTPAFDEGEFQLSLARQQQQVSINLQKTQYWATKLFRAGIFGMDSAYGTLISPEELAELSVSDIKAYHAKNFADASFDIFLSGQFDETTVMESMNKHFGGSSGTADVINQLSFDTAQTGLVEHALEGSNQSSVKMGQRTLDRSHKDFPGLALTNKILGGYFGSRLMTVIREEKGLTYGIHSSLMHLKQASFLQIAADVKMDSWEEVFDLINKEIESLKDIPVGIEELQLVKNLMTGEFQSQVNTAFDLAAKYKMLYYNQLPEDWYSTYLHCVHECSARDVQDMASNYFNTDQMLRVAVQ